MILILIIGTIDCIKSQLKESLFKVVFLRCFASGSGRVVNRGLRILTELHEIAECRVRNVNFILLNVERLEVFSSYRDDVSSLFGSGIGLNHGHLRIIVIPVLHLIFGELLTIE